MYNSYIYIENKLIEQNINKLLNSYNSDTIKILEQEIEQYIESSDLSCKRKLYLINFAERHNMKLNIAQETIDSIKNSIKRGEEKDIDLKEEFSGYKKEIEHLSQLLERYVKCTLDNIKQLANQLRVIDFDDISDKLAKKRLHTALMIASARGNMELVEILLEKNIANSYALPYAAEQGHLAIVKILLHRVENIINGVNKEQKTALMCAAEKGHLEIVKFLIEDNKGANINMQTKKGMTALMYAAEKGHSAIVELLIKNGGADINQVNCDGKRALDYAIEKGRKEIISLLINQPDVMVTKENLVNYQKNPDRDINLEMLLLGKVLSPGKRKFTSSKEEPSSEYQRHF